MGNDLHVCFFARYIGSESDIKVACKSVAYFEPEWTAQIGQRDAQHSLKKPAKLRMSGVTEDDAKRVVRGDWTHVAWTNGEETREAAIVVQSLSMQDGVLEMSLS